MGQNTVGTDQVRQRSLPKRAVHSLRRSFFLSLATFGLLLITAGGGLEALWMLGMPLENGVVAGMFGIWGTTAFTIGAVGYGTLRYLRND